MWIYRLQLQPPTSLKDKSNFQFSHYMIEISNSILLLQNQDRSKTFSVLFVGIYISKRFYKIDHSRQVTVLDWLITKNSSVLPLRDITDSPTPFTHHRCKPHTGRDRCWDATWLIVIFNTLQQSWTSSQPNQLGQLGEQITEIRGEPLKKGKVKWVDDMRVMTSLHLP